MTHPPAAINTENVPTAMRTGVGHTGLRLLGAAVDVAPEDLLGVLPSLKVPALPSLSLLESSDPLISAELGEAMTLDKMPEVGKKGCLCDSCLADCPRKKAHCHSCGGTGWRKKKVQP